MTLIQVRRDTAANFAAVNPVLAAGEPTYETNTGKRKWGDGVTAYNSLPYTEGTGDHGALAGLGDDDHTQYYNQARGDARYVRITSKGVASGVASLDTNARVPVAQLASGTPDGTKYLRDDGAWAVPAGGGGGTSDHGSLTGLADDDHPQYQLRSEKGQVNGYAGLDGTSKVAIGQIPTGTSSVTVALGNHTHTLDGLSDVVATSPAAGFVVRHDGTQWTGMAMPQASTTVVGPVELATASELTIGTDAARVPPVSIVRAELNLKSDTGHTHTATDMPSIAFDSFAVVAESQLTIRYGTTPPNRSVVSSDPDVDVWWKGQVPPAVSGGGDTGAVPGDMFTQGVFV